MWKLAAWKIAIVYVVGMWILFIPALKVAAGGHGFLLPLALYFFLSLPLSALVISLDAFVKQTITAWLAPTLLILAPLANVCAFYFIRRKLRQRGKRTS